jgi:hypothetical protein
MGVVSFIFPYLLIDFLLKQFFITFMHFTTAIFYCIYFFSFTIFFIVKFHLLIFPILFLFLFLVLRVLRVIRIFRALRPLKALRYFKGIVIFIESLAMSFDILLITTGMFLTAMVAIAFLTNSFIGDLLLNRCIPRTFVDSNGMMQLYANSTARDNPNYKAYGVDYFFSSYNLDYCKDL